MVVQALRRLIIAGWATALSGAFAPAASAQSAGALPDALRQSIAYYASLTSYSDTGTVRVESPGLVREARFVTHFRRPTRDLYFDFRQVSETSTKTNFRVDLGMYRTVLWMSRGEMQKYDAYQKTHESIDPDAQSKALQGAAVPTQGVSMLVPSLLYPKTQLPSAILQIEEAQLAGTEDIGGHRCHKIVGIAAARYPSGQRTGVRPITVWIDGETKLVRRVFEDTPKGYGAGSYLRITTDFQPQANPAISDDRFRFEVPAP